MTTTYLLPAGALIDAKATGTKVTARRIQATEDLVITDDMRRSDNAGWSDWYDVDGELLLISRTSLAILREQGWEPLVATGHDEAVSVWCASQDTPIEEPADEDTTLWLGTPGDHTDPRHCTHCAGHGKVFGPVSQDGPEVTGALKVCPECKGTGQRPHIQALFELLTSMDDDEVSEATLADALVPCLEETLLTLNALQEVALVDVRWDRREGVLWSLATVGMGLGEGADGLFEDDMGAGLAWWVPGEVRRSVGVA